MTARSLSLALLLGGCSLIVPSSGDFTYGDNDAGPGDAGRDAGASIDAGCPDLCGSVCTDLDTDPMHCGTCTRSCSAPLNGTPTCGGGTCGFECDSGYARVVGMCVERDAPRPIAPLSTSTVTSRRPTLRWELAARADGARIELCEDPACATVLQTIDAPGESARPPAELAPGTVFWRLFSLSDGVPGTVASPTWQMHVRARSADGDVDTSWGSILDVNNDGFADLAVGARRVDSETGRVYVYFGGPSGVDADVSSATVFDGPLGADQWFGQLVWSAGDLNGDGTADLLVAGRNGTAFVYFGDETGIQSSPAATFDTPPLAVVPAGDVNRDGYADLVRSSFSPLAVHIHLGGPEGVAAERFVSIAILDVEHATNMEAVRGIGDTNGDGYADLAVAMRDVGNDRGDVYVLLGDAAGVAATPARVIEDSVYVAWPAGDVDGDGHADMITRPSSELTLYRGWPTGFQAGAGTVFGGEYFVVAAGDVNGDGFDDVFANDLVYSGAVSSPLVSSTPVARPADPGAAVSSLAAGGDLDANGYPDLVFGCSSAYAADGRTYVFLVGATGVPPAPSLTLVPDVSNGLFGTSVAN